MKKLSFIFVISFFIFSACESTKESTESVAATAEEEADVVKTSEGVVLWPALVVRETGADAGKYITSIYQGEKLTLLGETSEDANSKNKNVYTKIALSDGTEGWALERFIAENGMPAAIQLNTPVYKRPDLLTKSDKEFSRMDFVAILDKDQDWIQVIGIPKGSTWFAEGWIRNDKVTVDEIDVSVAVLANRALNQENEEKKNSELQELVENTDFQNAVFYNDLQNILSAFEEKLVAAEEDLIVTEAEVEADTTTSQNF